VAAATLATTAGATVRVTLSGIQLAVFVIPQTGPEGDHGIWIQNDLGSVVVRQLQSGNPPILTDVTPDNCTRDVVQNSVRCRGGIPFINVFLGNGTDTVQIGPSTPIPQGAVTCILGSVPPRAQTVVDLGAGKDKLSVPADPNSLLSAGCPLGTVAAGPYFDPILDVNGRAGDDDITGGQIADTLKGDDGNDFVGGNGGDDNLQGGVGDDTIDGNDGNDTIDGADGKDVLSGNPGNDTLTGGAGDDTLNGNFGDDRLDGGGGKNTVSGGPGNDTLQGGAGDDTMNGDDGNDVFVAPSLCDGCSDGPDTINGGDGFDTVDYSSRSCAISIALASTLNLQGCSTERDTVIGVERVLGTSLNDTITGSNASDTLVGNDGKDLVEGGLGTDTLDGGPGDDRLESDEPVVAEQDFVSCGPGTDTAFLDLKDALKLHTVTSPLGTFQLPDCESVTRTPVDDSPPGRPLRHAVRLGAHAATVLFRCPATAKPSCRGQLLLRDPGRLDGRATYSLPLGRTASIRVGLTSAAVKRLRKGRLAIVQTVEHGHSKIGPRHAEYELPVA
jgi:Ca2+-binding RTX toxin-like protein